MVFAGDETDATASLRAEAKPDLETAAKALLAQIKERGAPLVMKIDNGPSFKSAAFQKVLEDNAILALYSLRRNSCLFLT